MSRARSLALQSIGAVLDRGAYSNIEASRALAGERLSEADRSLYKQLFYGVLERVIPLDYCIGRFSRMKKTSPALTNILRLGACQLLFLDRIPPRAAVDESVKLARRVAPQAAGFVNAVLRNIDRSRDGLLEELDRGGLSLKYSVHPAVAALLTDAYGHAATQAFFEGFTAQRSRICARVNTLRCSDASAFAAAAARDGITAEPGPLPDSVFLCFSKSLEQTAAWRDGLFHLQGAASQLAAAAVCAKTGRHRARRMRRARLQIVYHGPANARPRRNIRVRPASAPRPAHRGRHAPAGHCLYPARGRGRGGALSGIRTCRRGPCGRALLRLRDDGPPP